MKALVGTFEERAAAVIEAGLDIVLHCNGVMEEARAVASVAPVLSGVSLRRAKAAEAAIKAPQPFHVERGEQELAAIKAETRRRLKVSVAEALPRRASMPVLRSPNRFQKIMSGVKNDV